MAVSAWSNLLGMERCTVCSQKVLPSNATIASMYANGRPALACEMHRSDKATWVATWTNFYRQQELLSNAPPTTIARLYIETRAIKAAPDIKIDLAWHLFTRSMAGRCLVVASHPVEFLSVLKKHWKKITKFIHMERACTLDSPKRLALQEALGRLQTLSFSATVENMRAEVLSVSPGDIRLLTNDYATIYICAPLTEKQKTAMSKTLKQGALCVDYSGALGQWEGAA